MACHARELVEQFVPVLGGDGNQTWHVLMHPFTLHSLAKGHVLKYFAPWAQGGSGFVLFIAKLMTFARVCGVLFRVVFSVQIHWVCLEAYGFEVALDARSAILIGLTGRFRIAVILTSCAMWASTAEIASSMPRCS